MALTKCRECGGQVSTGAKACPHCGARTPARPKDSAWVGFGLVVVVAAIWGVVHPSDESSAPTVDQAPAVNVAPTPVQQAPAPYEENVRLERELAHEPSIALKMFPSAGYRDGAAGIFKAAGVRIIPGSESAWCSGSPIGNMGAGCYVQFTFTEAVHIGKSLPAQCGMLGRWRAPMNQPSQFAPDSGGARWIAKGDPGLLRRVAADDWRLCTSSS